MDYNSFKQAPKDSNVMHDSICEKDEKKADYVWAIYLIYIFALSKDVKGVYENKKNIISNYPSFRC